MKCKWFLFHWEAAPVGLHLTSRGRAVRDLYSDVTPRQPQEQRCSKDKVQDLS